MQKFRPDHLSESHSCNQVSRQDRASISQSSVGQFWRACVNSSLCSLLSADGRVIFRCCRPSASSFRRTWAGVSADSSPRFLSVTSNQSARSILASTRNFFPLKTTNLSGYFLLPVSGNRWAVCAGPSPPFSSIILMLSFNFGELSWRSAWA